MEKRKSEGSELEEIGDIFVERIADKCVHDVEEQDGQLPWGHGGGAAGGGHGSRPRKELGEWNCGAWLEEQCHWEEEEETKRNDDGFVVFVIPRSFCEDTPEKMSNFDWLNNLMNNGKFFRCDFLFTKQNMKKKKKRIILPLLKMKNTRFD